MRAVVDHFAGLDSPVHRMHPVCKWLAFVALALATVSVTGVGAACASLALAVAAVRVARLPVGLVAARVGAVALFLCVFVLLAAVTAEDRAAALLASCVVAVKCLAVVAWTTLLLGSMSTADAFAALRKLRLPDRFVEQLALSYRYVFAQGEELASLRRAAVCRGFKPTPTLRGLGTIGRLSGALVVRGLDRSQRIHDAMVVRGYDGRVRALASPAIGGADILKLGVSLAAAALLVVTRWI